MVRFLLWLAMAVAAAVCASGADTATGIFDRRFRTLKAEVEDNFMVPPVIRLGTRDRLIVKFDEIGDDNSYLEYRLMHCNADWQPSRLLDSEFVTGFNAERIEDFAFSTATFVHYVNYMIVIPGEREELLHSGNYLLQVYDPDEPESVLLQCRFQVTENAAAIRGDISSRTDRGHYGEWQQLDLSIDTEGLGNINPYQDLLVEIVQNGREASRRTLRTPMRVAGSENHYQHQPELIFPASNEYRRFESTSNLFPGMGVDSLRHMGSNYHVWLKPDAPRAGGQYHFDRTQHGRFIVREYNATDSDIGADYITVHFRLEGPELRGSEVYVEGEFTAGRYDDTNRMTYDPALGAYTLQMPLKQGAYNYQYVVRPAGSAGIPLPEPIEGNFHETQNEYTVNVWYRPPGARGDRLVGSRTLTFN